MIIDFHCEGFFLYHHRRRSRSVHTGRKRNRRCNDRRKSIVYKVLCHTPNKVYQTNTSLMLPLFIMLHLLLHAHTRRHLVLYRPFKQLSRFLFIRRFLVHNYIETVPYLLQPASRNFPIKASHMGISLPSSIRNIDNSLVITHSDSFSIDKTTG